MVMQGRHFEDPPPGGFEARDLEDDRHRLNDENATNNYQQEFLLAADGDSTQHAADGQRARVAHKYPGRIGIPPQEPEARPQECTAEDGQLAGINDIRNLKVAGRFEISCKIHEHRISRSHGGRAARRQPVEPVGEVHRIRSADDDEKIKDEREPPHAKDNRILEERDIELLRDFGDFWVAQEKPCEDAGKNALQAEFQPAANAVGAFFGDLQPVVVEADGSEEKHAEKDEPDEGILRTRPEQSRDQNGPNQEDSPHRGGAFFSAVQFEKFMDFFLAANRLPELQRDQLADDKVAKNQAQQERRDARTDRAKRDVRKNVEGFEKIVVPCPSREI